MVGGGLLKVELITKWTASAVHAGAWDGAMLQTCPDLQPSQTNGAVLLLQELWKPRR